MIINKACVSGTERVIDFISISVHFNSVVFTNLLDGLEMVENGLKVSIWQHLLFLERLQINYTLNYQDTTISTAVSVAIVDL